MVYVSSMPWCKRGVNLVRLVGTYLTALMSLIYESASDSCRFVQLVLDMLLLLMYRDTSRRTSIINRLSNVTSYLHFQREKV